MGERRSGRPDARRRRVPSTPRIEGTQPHGTTTGRGEDEVLREPHGRRVVVAEGGHHVLKARAPEADQGRGEPEPEEAEHPAQAQAALLSAAVILLAVFALLALFEIEKLNAATDTIIPNLDSIIEDLNQIEEGVDAAYEITKLMPLLYDMNELTGYIKGNLSITVQAMVNSPVMQGGLVGRR